MRFAKEAWPFVVPFLLAALALGIIGHPRWACLSAADGVVQQVDTVTDAAVGAGSFHRVVTFLSPLDVHVQRTPVEGQVVSARFTLGRKLPAFRPEAGEVNENHLTVLRRDNGELVGVRQIAGLVARRVVCHLRVGDRVTRGHPMGLIKFGSRVDVLVPASYKVLARVGQRLRNGETPVAEPGRPPGAAGDRP